MLLLFTNIEIFVDVLIINFNFQVKVCSETIFIYFQSVLTMICIVI